MSWLSSAWHSVTSGASSAYHAVADSAPVQAVTGAVTSVQNGITSGVHSVENAVRSGVSGAEDFVNRGTHALARTVSGVPVLGTVAGGMADAATFMAQVPGGAINGVTSMAGSLVNAAAHPLDTVRGLGRLAEMDVLTPAGYLVRGARHGLNVLTGEESVGTALNETFNPLRTIPNAIHTGDTMLRGAVGPDGQRHGGLIENYRRAIAEGRYGEIAGLLAADVGTFALGAGAARGASAAGRAGEVARAAEVLETTRAAGAGGEIAETARAAAGVRPPLPPPPPLSARIPVARPPGSVPLGEVPRPIYPYQARPPGTRTAMLPPEPPPQMPPVSMAPPHPPVVQHAPPLAPADMSDMIGRRSTIPMEPYQVPRPRPAPPGEPIVVDPGARPSAPTQVPRSPITPEPHP